MSIRKILILVFLTFIWAGCSKQVQDEYIYRDNKTRVMLVIRMANQTITDGHLVSSFLPCDGPLQCVRSQSFTFGVSSEQLAKKKWDIDKFHFQVTAANSGSQGNMIYTIVGKRNGERWEYTFDSKRGLVGMRTHAPDQKLVEFHLEANCGFAHSPVCRERTKN